MSQQPLTGLTPRWIYSEEPLRHGMGLSLQCPAHPHNDKDRSEFWFIRPLDGDLAITYGGKDGPERLYDFDGHDFAELTLWQAVPYQEESITSEHWWGYIASGQVYRCARWGGGF